MVSVMLIAVRNIKVTCESHKAIKLNYKNIRTHVIVVLDFQVLYAGRSGCYLVTSELACADCRVQKGFGLRFGITN